MDKFEVTNADYQQCVTAGSCADNEKYRGFTGDRQPVVGVSYVEARTYCGWAGKRLPTDLEWSQAAGMADGRKFPWGSDPINCSKANYKIVKTM